MSAEDANVVTMGTEELEMRNRLGDAGYETWRANRELVALRGMGRHVPDAGSLLARRGSRRRHDSLSEAVTPVMQNAKERFGAEEVAMTTSNYTIDRDGQLRVAAPHHESIRAPERPSGLEWARTGAPVETTTDGNFIMAPRATGVHPDAETCLSCGYTPSMHRGGKPFEETGGRCTQCRTEQAHLAQAADERRARLNRDRVFSNRFDEIGASDLIMLSNDPVVGELVGEATSRHLVEVVDRERQLLEQAELDLANDAPTRIVELQNDWQQRFGHAASVDW